MSGLAAEPVRLAWHDARLVNQGWGWHVLGLAAGVSLAVHGGLLAAFLPSAEDIQIDGGAPASVAALGNAFQDYTRGALPSQPSAATTVAPDTPPPPPPETLEAVPPEALAQPDPVVPADAAEPPAPAPATPQEAAPQPDPRPAEVAVPPDAAPSTLPETSAPAVPPDAAQPAQADAAWTPPATATMVAQSQHAVPAAAQPVAPAPPAAAPPPLTAARPVMPEVTAPAPEVEVQTADASTTRPARRPDRQEIERERQRAQQAQAQEQARRAERAQAASAAQAAGDADRDARRGVAQGQEQASAAAAAPRQAQAAAAGNAAAANYPGQVMRRIQRQRRPSVRARGSAVVAFSVAPGGGLAGARIARSSGSAELDQAAVSLVRGAAPFPAPPPGAVRDFHVEIAGR